jgi:hypothetical protein
MRRIFNQLRLQRVFDALLIKVFRNDDHGVLANERAMRLVKLKTVVSRQLYKAKVFFFNCFYKNWSAKTAQHRSLHKITSKRNLKDLSFGLKQWQNFTERSLKHEMR